MSTDQNGDPTPIESTEQLVQFFQPRAPVRGRVGVEWEQLALDGNWQMVPFDGPAGVEAVLEGMPEPRSEVLENGRLTALRLRGGGMIELEPGGQVEIASPPFPRLEGLNRFMARMLREADGVSRRLGFRLVPWGHAPQDGAEDLPDVPKSRYGLLAEHLRTAGARGRSMMKLTAATQISLDYEDEADMRRMVSAVLPVLPYLMAYTANSPVRMGRKSRWLSQRPWIWKGTDPGRCGLPRFLFSPLHGYADWVRYGLTRPLLFLVRDDGYVPGDGRSFEAWLKDPGGHGPLTVTDWQTHVSTLFPEIRVHRYLEVRTLDTLPLPLVMASAAFLKGLLCDPDAPGSWSIRFSTPDPPELRRALLEAARRGPRWVPGDGTSPHAVMGRLLASAARGLGRLGESEDWLAPLKDLVERDLCPADLWRRDAKGRWVGPEDPDPVF